MMHYAIFVQVEEIVGRRCMARREDVANARAEEGSEEKLGRGLACGGTVRAAECRDFTPRDWTEHSPTSIAKIEACTCPARKGRTLYASSLALRIPLFLFHLFLFVLASPVCFLPFCLFHSPSKLLSRAPFLPLGFVSTIRSSSFSSRPFRHASPSRLYLLLDRTLQALLSFMHDASLRVALYLLPFARCLVVHAVTLFPSAHAANAVSRLARVGHRVRNI